MRFHYIANARMPSEKAHGIQIAKMCEVFLEQGIDLVLVVPSRGDTKQSIKDFYGLKREIRTTVLPTLDWYHTGRVGYVFSTISFVVSYILYVLTEVKRGDIVYTVDLDHKAYAALPYLGVKYFCEMHGGKPDTFIHRALFKKAAGIIPTNNITKEQIKKVFGVPEEKFMVEPNGVDFSRFSPIPKEIAREKLHLDQASKLALYIGRFFDWKGLGILPQAVTLLPKDISIGLVGGSEKEFEKVTQADTHNLVFYGSQPYADMPLWEAAADILLVLGTKEDEQSWNYTSPMKVFEYMAMKRPIVASRTPALKNILAEGECYFYEPDNALDLARAIEEALVSDYSRAELAYQKVTQYSWDLRGKRIIDFIKTRIAS